MQLRMSSLSDDAQSLESKSLRINIKLKDDIDTYTEMTKIHKTAALGFINLSMLYSLENPPEFHLAVENLCQAYKSKKDDIQKQTQVISDALTKYLIQLLGQKKFTDVNQYTSAVINLISSIRDKNQFLKNLVVQCYKFRIWSNLLNEGELEDINNDYKTVESIKKDDTTESMFMTLKFIKEIISEKEADESMLEILKTKTKISDSEAKALEQSNKYRNIVNSINRDLFSEIIFNLMSMNPEIKNILSNNKIIDEVHLNKLIKDLTAILINFIPIGKKVDLLANARLENLQKKHQASHKLLIYLMIKLKFIYSQLLAKKINFCEENAIEHLVNEVVTGYSSVMNSFESKEVPDNYLCMYMQAETYMQAYLKTPLKIDYRTKAYELYQKAHTYFENNYVLKLKILCEGYQDNADWGSNKIESFKSFSAAFNDISRDVCRINLEKTTLDKCLADDLPDAFANMQDVLLKMVRKTEKCGNTKVSEYLLRELITVTDVVISKLRYLNIILEKRDPINLHLETALIMVVKLTLSDSDKLSYFNRLKRLDLQTIEEFDAIEEQLGLKSQSKAVVVLESKAKNSTSTTQKSQTNSVIAKNKAEKEKRLNLAKKQADDAKELAYKAKDQAFESKDAEEYKKAIKYFEQAFHHWKEAIDAGVDIDLRRIKLKAAMDCSDCYYAINNVDKAKHEIERAIGFANNLADFLKETAECNEKLNTYKSIIEKRKKEEAERKAKEELEERQRVEAAEKAKAKEMLEAKRIADARAKEVLKEKKQSEAKEKAENRQMEVKEQSKIVAKTESIPSSISNPSQDPLFNKGKLAQPSNVSQVQDEKSQQSQHTLPTINVKSEEQQKKDKAMLDFLFSIVSKETLIALYEFAQGLKTKFDIDFKIGGSFVFKLAMYYFNSNKDFANSITIGDIDAYLISKHENIYEFVDKTNESNPKKTLYEIIEDADINGHKFVEIKRGYRNRFFANYTTKSRDLLGLKDKKPNNDPKIDATINFNEYKASNNLIPVTDQCLRFSNAPSENKNDLCIEFSEGKYIILENKNDNFTESCKTATFGLSELPDPLDDKVTGYFDRLYRTLIKTIGMKTNELTEMAISKPWQLYYFLQKILAEPKGLDDSLKEIVQMYKNQGYKRIELRQPFEAYLRAVMLNKFHIKEIKENFVFTKRDKTKSTKENYDNEYKIGNILLQSSKGCDEFLRNTIDITLNYLETIYPQLSVVETTEIVKQFTFVQNFLVAHYKDLLNILGKDQIDRITEILIKEAQGNITFEENDRLSPSSERSSSQDSMSSRTSSSVMPMQYRSVSSCEVKRSTSRDFMSGRAASPMMPEYYHSVSDCEVERSSSIDSMTGRASNPVMFKNCHSVNDHLVERSSSVGSVSDRALSPIIIPKHSYNGSGRGKDFYYVPRQAHSNSMMNRDQYHSESPIHFQTRPSSAPADFAAQRYRSRK